jgi:hypothetical protein
MARLLVDDRARNKRVQFDNRALSQRQMIPILQVSVRGADEFFPAAIF